MSDPILEEARRLLRERRLPATVSLPLLFAALIAREESEARIKRWLYALTGVVGMLVLIHLNPATTGTDLPAMIRGLISFFGG